MQFSILMSVYHKEKAEYLLESLESIITQTLPPSEIVLVKDGPLTKDLDDLIEVYCAKYPQLFKIISLEVNSGLGYALSRGVEACSHNIIARMDTDDISKSNRFEKQLIFLKENPGIALVGSFIAEFEDSPENIYATRKVPLDHSQIFKFAKYRNPLNHMSVMFRKESVIEVNNYKTFYYFEDYYLWVRMLLNNSKMANIPEILVNVRAGKNMLNRRKGVFYIKQEIKIFYLFYKLGFINGYDFIKNVSNRVFLRVIPTSIAQYLYLIILRK